MNLFVGFYFVGFGLFLLLWILFFVLLCIVCFGLVGFFGGGLFFWVFFGGCCLKYTS